MSEKLIIPDEVVISKIYYIREQKVMLDSDLAELYNVETRVLNQQVKRNIDRFPDDFMFEGYISSMYRQIGNAVSPKFSFILAELIYMLNNQF